MDSLIFYPFLLTLTHAKMKRFGLSLGLWVFLIFLSTETLHAQKPVRLSKNTFGAIEARHIGPANMSGRITTIDALHADRRVLWVGAAGGGVWKSENAGTTFESVFDKHTQAIGNICIDQNHPDTVWVGTGEPWTRNSTSVGDGIYKTTNGGEKWKNMGLKETERIAKIIIHPEDPNTVYVAALGNLWNASEERGVFRTKDGGKSWEKILYVDENTGAASMAIDPKDPNHIYAAMWDFRRRAYDFRSGGPGSALYHTKDGGDNWTKIESDSFPDGTLGRIAIAVSPVEPHYTYAAIEAEESGLWVSEDDGKTWSMISDNPAMSNRPFYFSLLIPDTQDSARLYKPGTSLSVSDNKGESWAAPGLTIASVHSDHHAIWIDPNDNEFLYLGTDGGVYRSMDKAKTWSIIRNLPVSQFYKVSYDLAYPYNVYGGLQDNGSWKGPSRTSGNGFGGGGIMNSDWRGVGFGDGFNVLVDPLNQDNIFWESQGGNLNRRSARTGESKSIKPYSADSNVPLRFNWNTPFVFGQANQQNFYLGAQYLYRSKDRGDSWERISPDLTTNDPEKQKQEESGGLTIDNSTAENHCSIFAIAESPLDENIIWVGTDDGNLQLTTDGGKSWNNLITNIEGPGPNTWVSSVEPGHYDKNVCYVTLDGHRNGDKTPYVFVTRDMGKSWTALADKNVKGHAHVIKEDPLSKNLIFLGTEQGLFVSIDEGKVWTPFGGSIPPVSIRDMAIHPREHDLILGTHGRGIMIIDDLTPLRALNEEIIQKDLAFLPSKPYAIGPRIMGQNFPGDDEFTGQNPSNNAVVTYYLKKRHIFGDLFIEVFDQEGNLVKKVPSGKRKGINRVYWNTRRKAPKIPKGEGLSIGAAFGPSLAPGTYTIKLTKGEETFTTETELIFDPRSPHKPEDLQANYDAVLRSYELLGRLAETVEHIRALEDQAGERLEKLKKGKFKESVKSFQTELNSLRKTLVATKSGGITGEVRLREKLSDVYGGISGYTGRPTASQIQALEDISVEIEAAIKQFDEIRSASLAKINKGLKRQKLDALKYVPKEETEE